MKTSAPKCAAFWTAIRQCTQPPDRSGGVKASRLAKVLLEHGYAARTHPKQYGGYGAEPDALKARIIAEEFARAGVPGGIAGQGINMLVPTLLELGTDEQKENTSSRH